MLGCTFGLMVLQTMSGWSRAFRDESLWPWVVLACAAMVIGGALAGWQGDLHGVVLGAFVGTAAGVLVAIVAFAAHRRARLATHPTS
jgi:ABC-type xylose transport system permease subunit